MEPIKFVLYRGHYHLSLSTNQFILHLILHKNFCICKIYLSNITTANWDNQLEKVLLSEKLLLRHIKFCFKIHLHWYFK